MHTHIFIWLHLSQPSWLYPLVNHFAYVKHNFEIAFNSFLYFWQCILLLDRRMFFHIFLISCCNVSMCLFLYSYKAKYLICEINSYFPLNWVWCSHSCVMLIWTVYSLLFLSLFSFSTALIGSLYYGYWRHHFKRLSSRVCYSTLCLL